jgi:hypothetical protein
MSLQLILHKLKEIIVIRQNPRKTGAHFYSFLTSWPFISIPPPQRSVALVQKKGNGLVLTQTKDHQDISAT